MTIIRKDATIVPTGSEKDFPGTFEVILSAPTLDRDGDTLLPEEWKLPLPEHITFDTDHGMSVATTVGSGVPAIDEATGELKVSGTYSSIPRAQELRTLVNEGHIRTTSVAFMSEKTGKGQTSKTTRELLNGAFVAIPSNREALVLSSKRLDRKAGARNSASDAELIQAIMAAAVALGAEVTIDKDATRVAHKAIAGSVEALSARVRAALQDAHPGEWVWIRGTIPGTDDGGYVVFELEDSETYETHLFKQAYTDDGSTTTLTGEATPVDVIEVVTPDPAESTDSTSTDGAASSPAPGAPSPAAGGKTAPSTEPTDPEIQVRAAAIRARLAIESLTETD